MYKYRAPNLEHPLLSTVRNLRRWGQVRRLLELLERRSVPLPVLARSRLRSWSSRLHVGRSGARVPKWRYEKHAIKTHIRTINDSQLCSVLCAEVANGFACPAAGEISNAGSFSRHAHPEDCRKYYICLEGVAREYGCPIGTVFKIGEGDGTGNCEDPEDVPGWYVTLFSFFLL